MSSNLIKLGTNSGQINQGNNSIAIGHKAGELNLNSETIAVGYGAAQNTSGNSSVCVGSLSGFTGAAAYSVNVGTQTSMQNSGHSSVNIGPWAGKDGCGVSNINIGNKAGYNGGNTSNVINIGPGAGFNGKKTEAVSIGNDAGRNQSGTNPSGEYSLCLGSQAGADHCHDKTIIINASNTALNSDMSGACFIKPIRNPNNWDDPNEASLRYNIARGELYLTLTGDRTPAISLYKTATQTIPNTNPGNALLTWTKVYNYGNGTFFDFTDGTTDVIIKKKGVYEFSYCVYDDLVDNHQFFINHLSGLYGTQYTGNTASASATFCSSANPNNV
eukprot:Pgem_evm1s19510